MDTLEQGDTETASPDLPGIKRPRIRWSRMLAISIFAFAINFHWGALGIIILPSQVLRIAGNFDKGTALAFVLIPGAFVSLVANPFFGWLSDHTRGRLAIWGRRRFYILLGTLLNIAALFWMATAHSILTLTCAYILIQFASNAAQAPFHALLPDIVPSEQRGLTSGVIGLLTIAGNVGGVLVAGSLLDGTKPQLVYQQELWLTYGIIMGVMLVLMLVTILSVRERAHALNYYVPIDRQDSEKPVRRSWIARSTLLTLLGMTVAVLVVWTGMQLWNMSTGIKINSSVQQVVLELVTTVGILRLFEFQPRRHPDFAWVFVTRLVMMLGIYTIQDFLQFYMRDVIGATHPEQATTNFLILVSLTSLVSAFIAGWLSDHFGRKRLVYLSGAFMLVVGVIFVFTHSFVIVMVAGMLFGLGYGAYQSVDWALVADVLPSEKHYARDMGIWNIALSLPQVIAPVLGGPLIDNFTRSGHPIIGYQLLFAMAIIYCLLGTVTVRFIKSVRR
ncbi:MAG: MFS transporter [Ktedonobacteraceae bacterium]|nr:MFS transporter [Ktedonobacteraceae bacterium]